MAVLLSQPVIVITMVIAISFLFPIFNALRHPTPAGCLTVLYIATGTAAVGIVLLFCAKLPQYKQGVFLRFGASGLPPRSQRLYRLAYRLIVPSCPALLVLLAIASGVR